MMQWDSVRGMPPATDTRFDEGQPLYEPRHRSQMSTRKTITLWLVSLVVLVAILVWLIVTVMLAR